jgi:hypothetical protein
MIWSDVVVALAKAQAVGPATILLTMDNARGSW